MSGVVGRDARPRLLPDGVDTCPTCGATTDLDAEILYSIDRVLTWKEQTRDPDVIAVYDAGIEELRAMLAARETP